MKKLFVLPALMVFVAVSSCQKNDSTIDQVAERKAQLDAREKALDAREKSLDARERTTTDSRAATALQAVPPDAQAELKRLIPDPAHVKAERQRRLQERISQRQRKLLLERLRLVLLQEQLRAQKIFRRLRLQRRSNLCALLALRKYLVANLRVARRELAGVLKRVDRVDVFVAPDGFDPRETQCQSTRMTCTGLD